MDIGGIGKIEVIPKVLTDKGGTSLRSIKHNRYLGQLKTSFLLLPPTSETT
jgi:hypothetical protein